DIAEAVDVRLSEAEVLVETGADRAEVGEEEAAIGVHAWQRRQAQLLVVQDLVVPLLEGHALEAAVHVVGPAVVGAGEGLRVAALQLANGVPAMPAAVVEDIDAILLVADDDDRLLAYHAGTEVAGIGDLTLMADEDPLTVPDAV